MIVAFDLAPRKCGWVAGSGATIPTAGGFRLTHDLEDLGGCLEALRQEVASVFARFRPSIVLYEEPILPMSGGKSVVGSLAQRRLQFAQGAFLEWMSLDRGVRCREVSVFDVKQALAGTKRAEKPDMVAMATRLGVRLPAQKVDGREDAADALGVWLVGVRFYAKQFAPDWDRRVWSPRGAML